MAAQAHRASLAAAPLSVLQEMDSELAATLDRQSSHAARHNLSRTPPGQQSGLAHLQARWAGTVQLCCAVGSGAELSKGSSQGGWVWG